MASNLYISVADYKTLNGITDASSDAVIESIIEAASRIIDRYCGRVFYEEEALEPFDGTGTGTYYTKHRPIISPAEVILQRDRNGDGTYTETIDSDEFTVYDNRISLKWHTDSGLFRGEGSVFYVGQKNWRVFYYYGAAEVPRPVEIAASMMTTYLLTEGGSTLKLSSVGVKGILSERIGNYAYTVGYELAKSGILPPPVASILSMYRHIRVGGRGDQG